jgi:ribosomal protein S27E
MAATSKGRTIMPPITCPECGEQNLVFFRTVKTSHCRGCGAELPTALAARKGRAMTSKVIEASGHDLRRVPPSGSPSSAVPPR